jgi:hypothetical protein
MDKLEEEDLDQEEKFAVNTTAEADEDDLEDEIGSSGKTGSRTGGQIGLIVRHLCDFLTFKLGLFIAKIRPCIKFDKIWVWLHFGRLLEPIGRFYT